MPYLGNVPSSFNVGTDNINNDAITTAKIADGAILNADVNAAAAIAGTKISPDFGSQNILTTGTATAASLIPTSSTTPTNGLFLPAANTLGISTNGTGRLEINNAGVISHKVYDRWEQNDGTSVAGYIGNANLVLSSGNQADFALRSQANIAFATGGGTERARITSSGQFLIGTSSTSTNATMILQGYAADANDGGIIRLATGKATPASGDVLGYLNFTDSTHTAGAQIRGERDGGTWSGSSKPGRLVFSTTADGASSSSERLRITSNGNIYIGGGTFGKIDSTTSKETQFSSYLTLGQFSTGSAPGYLGWNITATANAGIYKARVTGDRASVLTLNSGGDLLYSAATSNQTEGVDLTNFGERVRFLAAGGITFNGDTAAANALDDYEEGTWTPAFVNAGTATYGAQVGRYTKIGNLVYATAYLDINTVGTASGKLRISGLPFTTANNSAYFGSSSVHGTGWTTARRSLNILWSANVTNSDEIYYNMAGTTQSANPSITGSDWGTADHSDLGTGNLLFSLVYQAS